MHKQVAWVFDLADTTIVADRGLLGQALHAPFPEAGCPDLDACVFDPETARRHLGLDASGFSRIVTCIWTEVSKRRCLLEEALATGDLARVALHAHTIKSSAATIGAGALRQAAATVEHIAGKGRREELPAAVATFRTAAENLSKLLGMG